MSVARVTEIISASSKSFDDAINEGEQRANATLKNVEGVWIKDQSLQLKKGEIGEYRVAMMVTFVLDEIARRSANARRTAPRFDPSRFQR